MTAIREQAPRTPPRIVVRTFWTLHRSLYRISGGRVGLTRPQAGDRFGMLRLTTLGRRSGQPRVAMVGYFEDGPNLVTLAMNGWGDADPAWWLNLQATPDTTVDLPDGPREVRAREATGEERQRLWRTFRDYPGWGTDIDALAARRSRETAVVVLEPRTAGLPASAGTAVGRSPAAKADQPRRLAARLLWLLPGLGLGLVANAQAAQHGLGLAPLLLFGIAPHLTVLAGLGQRHAPGQLGPRAVALFNAMHHPVAPLAVLGLAATGLLSPFWLAGALAWLSHIVVDWGLGDGMRTPDGFRPGAPAAG